MKKMKSTVSSPRITVPKIRFRTNGQAQEEHTGVASKSNIENKSRVFFSVLFLVSFVAAGVTSMGLAFLLGQKTRHVFWLKESPYCPNYEPQKEEQLVEEGRIQTPQTILHHDSPPVAAAGFFTTTVRRSRKGCEQEDAHAAGGEDQDKKQKNDAGQAFLPPGTEHHVTADFRNVDVAFLRDEQQLSHAMLNFVKELVCQDSIADNMEHNDDNGCGGSVPPIDHPALGLTELTYYCHKHMVPADAGISCAGAWLVMDEFSTAGRGRIFIHTRPTQGVMILDLFVSPDDDDTEELQIRDIISVLERIFAVPRREDLDGVRGPPAAVDWAYSYRGFNNAWDENPDVAASMSRTKDLGMALGRTDLDWKQVVATVETPFQQIVIVDIIDPKKQSMDGYLNSLEEDRVTYEAMDPDLFIPNRQVFLDGVLQSTLRGDAAYHEGLVHPGMLAHAHPKRAAIIGGGEGATLREVLRHDTIEHVKMIEIDAIMVAVSRDSLVTWNSCADIVGSTPNCFDEPRADVRMEDALSWFINNFGQDDTLSKEEKFDVIIMDALDPQDNVFFAAALYSNDDFTESLYNALTPEGVLILQLGEVPLLDDVPDEYSKSHMRASLEQDLIHFGFQSLHQYEEPACDFDYPWSYLVAFKSAKTREHWYANEAQVNLKIKQRLRPRIGESNNNTVSPLRYFDGATMAKYQVPHNAFEAIYCRSPSASTGICNARYGEDHSLVNIPPSTWKSLMNIKNITSTFKPMDAAQDTSTVLKFVEKIGTQHAMLGAIGYSVSTSSILTHGGGGERRPSVLTEIGYQTKNNWVTRERNSMGNRTIANSLVFNPAMARHMPHLMAAASGNMLAIH